MARETLSAADPAIVPANEAACEDLQTVFGTRGAAQSCRCQRYKLRPREAFAKLPVAERARRLREQTHCGDPMHLRERPRRLPRAAAS